MNEQSVGTGIESRHLWDHLEEFVCGPIQQFEQRLFVVEVTQFGWVARSRLGARPWMRRRDTATGMGSLGSWP